MLKGLPTQCNLSVTFNQNGRVVGFSGTQNGFGEGVFEDFDKEKCREKAEQKVKEKLTKDGQLTNDYRMHSEMFFINDNGMSSYKASFFALDQNGNDVNEPIYVTVNVIRISE